MNILIANDDGVFAPGIQALAHALKPLGRVVIVAPESERSGFSSALTLDRPLRPIPIAEDIWAVNGTPADCVYLSMNGLFDFEFDLVVSGINSGANLGDDVLYSGTVGAAFEGRLMTQPAIAVSLAGPNVRAYQHPADYAVAAQWVHDFIANGLPTLPPRHILNINIPDVAELKGAKLPIRAVAVNLNRLPAMSIRAVARCTGLDWPEKPLQTRVKMWVKSSRISLLWPMAMSASPQFRWMRPITIFWGICMTA